MQWSAAGQGNIQLIITLDRCSDTLAASISVMDITAMPHIAISSIALYPNPAQNIITLKGGNTTTTATLELFNALGIQLLQQYATQAELQQGITLNTSTLDAGVYFLSIRTDSGTRVMKMVKE